MYCLPRSGLYGSSRLPVGEMKEKPWLPYWPAAAVGGGDSPSPQSFVDESCRTFFEGGSPPKPSELLLDWLLLCCNSSVFTETTDVSEEPPEMFTAKFVGVAFL